MVLGGPKGVGKEPRDPSVAGADVQVMEALWGSSGQGCRLGTDPGGGTTGPLLDQTGKRLRRM